MSHTAIHVSTRIYSFLLRLYPKSYRQEFEKEMLFVFSEQLKDSYKEQGDLGIVQVWANTTMDAFKSLITQHIENYLGVIMNSNQIQKSAIRIAAVTGGILLIPLIGMQVSSEWNWSLSDFIIIGILLTAIGSMIEYVRHTVKNNTKRTLLVVVLILLCLWIWAELAVGIFTNWGS